MENQPGACRRCNQDEVCYKRDRILWHVCFWGGFLVGALSWLAIPFLSKKPYCTRCSEENWHSKNVVPNTSGDRWSKVGAGCGILSAVAVVLFLLLVASCGAAISGSL